MLELATSQQWPRHQVEALYERARASASDYLPILTSRPRGTTRRDGMARSQTCKRFIDRSDRGDATKLGETLYTRLMWVRIAIVREDSDRFGSG